MKKLMTLMLGMAFVFTTVAVTFAQGDTTKKEEKKKAPKKKKGDTTKKINDNKCAWIQFISTRPWQRPRLHIGEEFHGFHDAFLHTIT